MSSEWDENGGDGADVYRNMWEEVGDEWNFDAWYHDQGRDWPVWDGRDVLDQHQQDGIDLEPSSSSYFTESSSPPSRARDPPAPPPAESSSHEGFLNTVLRPMGNTSSAASTHPRQSPEQVHHNATTSTTTTHRSRPSAAGHSEDWLDRAAQRRSPPSGYIPEAFLRSDSPNHTTEEDSDGIDIDDILTDADAVVMAPSTRRHRSRNSIVDLTHEPSSPPTNTTAPARQPTSLKRAAESAAQGPANKRSRRAHETEDVEKVEELDLTTEEDLQRAQQQEAAIRAQQASAAESSNGPSKLGKRQCIICMEPFTNATITHCGHIYCHECLTQALLAGEKNSERGVGNCPVCRKPVNRKKANHIIPLALMKKAAYKGKGRRDLALLG